MNQAMKRIFIYSQGIDWVVFIPPSMILNRVLALSEEGKERIIWCQEMEEHLHDS